MSPQDGMVWFQVAWLLLSTAALIGVWRGRQEAADKAAEKALQNAESRFEDKVQELERRIDEGNDQRQREYNNLHTKANETQRLISELFTQMLDRFAQKDEFNRSHDRFAELERRVNNFFDTRVRDR